MRVIKKCIIFVTKMEEYIEFAKWCLCIRIYVYDSNHGWFHRKSMKKYSWEKMYEIYVKQKNK